MLYTKKVALKDSYYKKVGVQSQITLQKPIVSERKKTKKRKLQTVVADTISSSSTPTSDSKIKMEPDDIPSSTTVLPLNVNKKSREMFFPVEVFSSSSIGCV